MAQAEGWGVMSTYYRKIEFVMEVGPDSMGGGSIVKALKDAGVDFLWFSQMKACDSCAGRAYLDDGPQYATVDCIRRSEKCPDCDERGRGHDAALKPS